MLATKYISIFIVQQSHFCTSSFLRFQNKEEFSWKSLLKTEQSKQRFIENLKFNQSLRPKKKNSPKKFALLVPFLINDNEEPKLLFTKRSLSMTKHTGEVCFPGGKLDEIDGGSFEAAALRETHEEIGLASDKCEIIVTSHPTATIDNIIVPVVALIHNLDIKSLKLNKDEVKELVVRPISELCSKHNIGYTQFRSPKGGYSMPVFDKSSPYRVWGLTAIVTHHILSALVPLEHYEHKIIFKSKS